MQDPRNSVALEQLPEGSVMEPRLDPGLSAVDRVDYGEDQVRMDLHTTGGGSLVGSDAHSPG